MYSPYVTFNLLYYDIKYFCIIKDHKYYSMVFIKFIKEKIEGNSFVEGITLLSCTCALVVPLNDAGANSQTRTDNLLITNQLHYQLCYISISLRKFYVTC